MRCGIGLLRAEAAAEVLGVFDATSSEGGGDPVDVHHFMLPDHGYYLLAQEE